MNLFGPDDAIKSNKVNQSNKTNMSSPLKNNTDDLQINMQSVESGVKPVQLDDFFEFLDEKTVQKIMETPAESKARITQDVAQMEYETDGAMAILNSLG